MNVDVERPEVRSPKRRKWVFRGSNPTTGQKYFDSLPLVKKEKAGTSPPPEDSPEEIPVQSAQVPSGSVRKVDYGDEGPYWSR